MNFNNHKWLLTLGRKVDYGLRSIGNLTGMALLTMPHCIFEESRPSKNAFQLGSLTRCLFDALYNI